MHVVEAKVLTCLDLSLLLTLGLLLYWAKVLRSIGHAPGVSRDYCLLFLQETNYNILLHDFVLQPLVSDRRTALMYLCDSSEYRNDLEPFVQEKVIAPCVKHLREGDVRRTSFLITFSIFSWHSLPQLQVARLEYQATQPFLLVHTMCVCAATTHGWKVVLSLNVQN